MSSIKVVLMAGGNGTRFWPRSSSELPKQFLDFDGTGPLIRKAYNRALALVETTDIYVSTQRAYADLVRLHLPEVPPANFILEPEARDTAPALGLAAVTLQHDVSDAIMVAFPSDHMVGDDVQFLRAIRAAIQAAEKHDGLVTIGLHPTRPETGYGYIQLGPLEAKYHATPVHRVMTFKEKPTEEVAAAYLQAGTYLWNSGILVARLEVFRSEIAEHLPELDTVLTQLASLTLTSQRDLARVGEIFARAPRISIDYGVLERSRRVLAVAAEFPWDDLGTWSALARLGSPDACGNVVNGPVIPYDSHNLYVEAQHRVVAAVGVKDLIVIDSENGVLICSKDRTQDVRKVAEAAQEATKTQLNRFRPSTVLATVAGDWGQEYVWAATPQYTAKLVLLAVGGKRSQASRLGYSTLFIQSGTVCVLMGNGRTHNATRGCVVTIPPGFSYEVVAVTSACLLQVDAGPGEEGPITADG